MTYHELYEQLLAKNYTPRPCGDHVEGAYCCATAIYENWEEFKEDPAGAEEMLRNFLELDRLAIFVAWYGDREEGWGVHLDKAHELYSREKIGYAVEYIPLHP